MPPPQPVSITVSKSTGATASVYVKRYSGYQTESGLRLGGPENIKTVLSLTSSDSSVTQQVNLFVGDIIVAANGVNPEVKQAAVTSATSSLNFGLGVLTPYSVLVCLQGCTMHSTNGTQFGTSQLVSLPSGEVQALKITVIPSTFLVKYSGQTSYSQRTVTTSGDIY